MKLYSIAIPLLIFPLFGYFAFFTPDRALDKVEDNVLTKDAYVEVLEEDFKTVKEKSKAAYEFYTTQGESANHSNYNK